MAKFQEFHIQSSPSWEKGHFSHKTDIHNEANAMVLLHPEEKRKSIILKLIRNNFYFITSTGKILVRHKLKKTYMNKKVKFSINLRMKRDKHLHSYHRMPLICCFLGLIYPDLKKKRKKGKYNYITLLHDNL